LFLKGDQKHGLPAGEIEEYAGIEIEWNRGKQAILTIFDDEGNATEKIKLYELKTRAEMHKLISDKGFRKKTRLERAAQRQGTATEKQLRAIDRPSSGYGNLKVFYYMAFVLIVAGGFALHGRKRTKKSLRGGSSISRI